MTYKIKPDGNSETTINIEEALERQYIHGWLNNLFGKLISIPIGIRYFLHVPSKYDQQLRYLKVRLEDLKEYAFLAFSTYEEAFKWYLA